MQMPCADHYQNIIRCFYLDAARIAWDETLVPPLYQCKERPEIAPWDIFCIPSQVFRIPFHLCNSIDPPTNRISKDTTCFSYLICWKLNLDCIYICISWTQNNLNNSLRECSEFTAIAIFSNSFAWKGALSLFFNIYVQMYMFSVYKVKEEDLWCISMLECLTLNCWKPNARLKFKPTKYILHMF